MGVVALGVGPRARGKGWGLGGKRPPCQELVGCRVVKVWPAVRRAVGGMRGMLLRAAGLGVAGSRVCGVRQLGRARVGHRGWLGANGVARV